MFPFSSVSRQHLIPSWFLLCLGMCYLFSTYSWIFQYSSYYWFYFHTTVVREDTWYDFSHLKFVKTCFVSSEAATGWGWMGGVMCPRRGCFPWDGCPHPPRSKRMGCPLKMPLVPCGSVECPIHRWLPPPLLWLPVLPRSVAFVVASTRLC